MRSPASEMAPWPKTVPGWMTNVFSVVAPFTMTAFSLMAVIVPSNWVAGSTAAGAGLAGFAAAMQSGAVAQVEENTVRDNVCTGALCGPDPINDVQSVGIFVNDAQGGSEISENSVADNDVGIYQVASPNCCTISENKLTNNRFFGIVIQDGDGTTSGNKIKGGRVGIGVVADAVDTVGVLRGDKINRTSVAPVQEIDCCGFTATAIVRGD